jgi:hypothetical protein
VTKAPYPGYPPSYKTVKETAGYRRNCLVLELLTLGELEPVALALIQEQLEATLERLGEQLPYLERTDVVLPDRFDPVLKEGLRL